LIEIEKKKKEKRFNNNKIGQNDAYALLVICSFTKYMFFFLVYICESERKTKTTKIKNESILTEFSR
jgi:hypothetical protein